MTEEKTRIHTRISPETEQKIAAAMPFSNCRSQNEFVEKALQFYCEHLTAQDTFSALPPVLLSAIRATVQASEDRICRLLFKLAVEMDSPGPHTKPKYTACFLPETQKTHGPLWQSPGVPAR